MTINYKGDWERGERHGNGIVYVNGEKVYDGEWRQGEPHGDGTEYSNGKKVYEGQFKSGNWHGKGTLYENDGVAVMHEGQFIDGDICSAVPRKSILLKYAKKEPTKKRSREEEEAFEEDMKKQRRLEVAGEKRREQQLEDEKKRKAEARQSKNLDIYEMTETQFREWCKGQKFSKNDTAKRVKEWKKKMTAKGKEHMLSPDGKKK